MRSLAQNFRVPVHAILWAGIIHSCFALPLSPDTSPNCTQPKWQSLIVFFGVNYVAHAATVPSKPGGKWMENLPWIFLSLLLPFAGLGRSIGLVISYLTCGRDDLGKAISRSAVMIAARSKKWEPPSTHEQRVYVKLPDEYSNPVESDAELGTAKFKVQALDTAITHRNHAFHGQTLLPPDRYEWVLEEPVRLEKLSSDLESRNDIRIGQDQSWIKMITSVAQLILSCITIYRARGSQLDQFGYAAFGLSVFPYAMMSLVNLVFVGVLGEYPCIYMVRTAILEEAMQCGASISGDIGVLKEKKAGGNGGVYTPIWLKTEENEQGKILTVRPDDDGATTRSFRLVGRDDPADLVFTVDSVTNQENDIAVQDSINDKQDFLLGISLFVSAIIVFIIPYVFIFLLTGFHNRDSSLAERGWMMSWLVANQLTFVVLFVVGAIFPQFSWDWGTAFVVLFMLSPVIVPAIGGFVTVGKMVFKFSSCP